MPKLGEVKKMNDDPGAAGIYGMWDGCFWSKVEWYPGKGWLIPESIIANMRDTYEPRN